MRREFHIAEIEKSLRLYRKPVLRDIPVTHDVLQGLGIHSAGFVSGIAGGR